MPVATLYVSNNEVYGGTFWSTYSTGAIGTSNQFISDILWTTSDMGLRLETAAIHPIGPGATSLQDMPADFDSATSITVTTKHKSIGVTNDVFSLYVQLFQADKTTPLTNELLVYNAGANWADTTTGPQTMGGVVPGTKAIWDGACLKFRLAVGANMGADAGWQVLIDTISFSVTYAASPTITQAAYRFYAEGAEATSVALAAQNTPPAVSITGGDVNLQLRMLLQETGANAVPNTTDLHLEYAKNGGAWTDVLSDPAIITTYPFSQWSNWVEVVNASGQSFTGNGEKLARMAFDINKNGTPPGTYSAALYAHAGTFGTSSVGTGAALATSTTVLTAADISATFGWVFFEFDGTFTLANGTNYVMAITRSTVGDASNRVNMVVDFSGPVTRVGNRCDFNGSTWTASATYDYMTRVYTKPTVVPTNVTGYNNTANYDLLATQVVEGTSTTQRLTGGTGTFSSAGTVAVCGLCEGIGWAVSGNVELLFALRLLAADLVNGDQLTFRVVKGGNVLLNAYTVTPSLTAQTTPPIDLFVDNCTHSHVSQQLEEHYLTPSVGYAEIPDPGAMPFPFSMTMKIRGPATTAVGGVGVPSAWTLASKYPSHSQGCWIFTRYSAGDATAYQTYAFTLYTNIGSTSPGSQIHPGTPGSSGPQYLATTYSGSPSSTNRSFTSPDGLTWTQYSGGASGAYHQGLINLAGVVRVGNSNQAGSSTYAHWDDRIYWLELRTNAGVNGDMTSPTNGTLVWRFDAREHVSGTSWTGSDGRAWTISNASAITHVPAATNVTLQEIAVTNLVVQNAQHNFVVQTEMGAFITPLVGRATTPDPVTLPTTGFVFVFKSRGPKYIYNPGLTPVSQNAGDPNRSFRTYRLGVTGEVSLWAYPVGTVTGASASINGGVLVAVDLANAEYWAMSYNCTTGAWRTLSSVDAGVNYIQRASGTDASPDTFFDGSSPLMIGADSTGAASVWDDRIYWVECRTGNDPKAGTLLWRFDPAEHVSGTNWTDARGNVWTLTSAAAVTHPDSETVVLTEVVPAILVVQNAAHAHVADNVGPLVEVLAPVNLVVANAGHAITDAVTLQIPLTVASAAHTTVSDNVTTNYVVLVPADAYNTQIATTVALGVDLYVANALQAHTADIVTLLIPTNLTVANAQHTHTAANVVLYYRVLVVKNCYHSFVPLGYNDVKIGSISTPNPGLPPSPMWTVVGRVSNYLDNTPVMHGRFQDTQHSWDIMLTRSQQLDWAGSQSVFTHVSVNGSGSYESWAGLLPSGPWEYFSVTVQTSPKYVVTVYWSIDGVTWQGPIIDDWLEAPLVPFASTQPLTVGYPAAFNGAADGFIHWVEVRDGNNPNGGTLIWRCDLAEYSGTGGAWTDARGRTWTLSNPASFVPEIKLTETLAPSNLVVQDATHAVTSTNITLTFGWNPMYLSGLTGWWDAQDAGSIVGAPNVTSWNDLSGGGHHLVTTGVVQKTTVNGLPMLAHVVPGAGSNGVSMSTTGWTRPTVETIFTVFWWNSTITTGASDGLYVHKQVSAGDRSAYWYGGNSWYSGYNSYYAHSRGISLDQNRHIIGTQSNGGSSWFEIDGDRSFGSNSVAAPVDFQWSGVATTNAAGSAWAAGEIITVNGTLTPAEIEEVYRYLRNKWDIPVQLHVHNSWHWHQSEQVGVVPAPYTDDFNRADGDPGPNWQMNLVNGWTISNNRLVKLSGTDWINWVPAMTSSDHYVQARFYNAAEEFAFVRARGTGSLPTHTDYEAGNYAGVQWRISKEVAGVETLIQAYAWPQPQDGDTIRIDVRGNQIALWTNTTRIGILTNNDITTGTIVGLMASAGTEIDYFEAGYRVPDITLTETIPPVDLVVANGQHAHTTGPVVLVHVPTLKVRNCYHFILPAAGKHHEPLLGHISTPNPGSPPPTPTFSIIAKVSNARDVQLAGQGSWTGTGRWNSVLPVSWAAGLYLTSLGNTMLAFDCGNNFSSGANYDDEFDQVAGCLNAQYWAMVVQMTPTYEVTGYYSYNGTDWTAFPAQSSGYGAHAIWPMDVPLRVAPQSSTGAAPYNTPLGQFYWVEMRSGSDYLNGSLLWRMDIDEYVTGTAWTDARGRTWTLSNEASVVFDPILTQVVNLTAVQDAFQGISSDNVTLQMQGDLSVQNANQAHIAANVDITQLHVIAVQDAVHAHTAVVPTLYPVPNLVVASAVHAHTTENLALNIDLYVQSAVHAHSAGAPVLVVDLVVASAVHAHSAGNTVLYPVPDLIVAAAIHAHTSVSPVLVASPAVQDGIHAITSTDVIITPGLLVNNGYHFHDCPEVSLTGVPTLSIQPGNHNHIADNIALNIPLAVQNAAQAHAADNVAPLGVPLAVQSATNAHTADNLIITPGLLVDSAIHLHTATHVSPVTDLAVQSAVQAHVADNVVLVQTFIMVVDSAVHAHTAANVTLTQLHVLVVAAGVHAHIGEQVTLSNVPMLNVQGSTLAHSAANVPITQQQNLALDSAWHDHLVNTLTLTGAHFLIVQSAVHAHHAANVDMRGIVVLNNALAVYLGGVAATRIYCGSAQVWP